MHASNHQEVRQHTSYHQTANSTMPVDAPQSKGSESRCVIAASAAGYSKVDQRSCATRKHIVWRNSNESCTAYSEYWRRIYYPRQGWLKCILARIPTFTVLAALRMRLSKEKLLLLGLLGVLYTESASRSQDRPKSCIAQAAAPSHR